jgi:acyl-CoA synthetase (NDP forming)
MAAPVPPPPSLGAGGVSALLNPESIAIIGASADRSRVGGMPLHFLDAVGYEGRVYPVNPARAMVQGHRAYPDVGSVPEPADLAIVAVPAARVPATLAECAQAGVRGAVVFSAGFAEVDAEGAARQDAVRQIARESGMRVCGPNCAGIMNLRTRMTATFGSHLAGDQTLIPGHIAIVSQSGAVGAYTFTLARARGVGLSHWVTTGNEADTGVPDYVAAIASDPETRVIALYLEQFRDAEAFMAACQVAREHDVAVVALLAGKTEAAEQALRSHTAAMAGNRAVASAALADLGVVEVDSLDELLGAATALSGSRRAQGRRVGVVTISGAAGIMMVDRCAQHGLSVPTLGPERQRRMKALLGYASTANPLDVTGNVSNTPEVFGAFVEELLDADEIDSVIVFLGHVVLSPHVGRRLLDELAVLSARQSKFVALVAADGPDGAAVKRLAAAELPTFSDPSRAIDGLAAAVRAREALADPSPSVLERRAAASRREAAPLPELPARRAALSEAEAQEVLTPAGVRFPAQRIATTAEAAAAAAVELGRTLVMKILSPDILHKSDVGGVRVGVEPADAATVFGELIAAAAAAAPDARIDGVLLQELLGGHPVIVGTKLDDVFGPTVLVGSGGIDAELIADRALALAPLDEAGAAALLARTKLGPIIAGARGREPLDAHGLVRLLVDISALAWRLRDRVATVELNPVLLGSAGPVAVDALIELKGAANGD